MKLTSTNLYLSALLACGLTVMTACSDKRVDASEYERVVAERDSLEKASTASANELTTINDYLSSVAQCVDSISYEEGMLSVTTDMETGRRYTVKEIKQRLNDFSELLHRQRMKIAQLTDSLKVSDPTQLENLTAMINFLNEQLSAKEAQVEALRKEVSQGKLQISQLTAKVEALNETNTMLDKENKILDQTVAQQSQQLNQGYFLAADKKTLEQKGILKKGGFLKKASFDTGNVSLSECTVVDTRRFNDVLLESKKPKLLTQQPSSSYTFEDAGDGKKKLVILDTVAFWSVSNMVIIQL